MACIGIDLGTTNSLAAVWRNNKVEIIPNAMGELMTPSVVSISDKGEIIIGQAARERLVTHPGRTFGGFKRTMGSQWQGTIARKTFSSEELSSLILRQLKEDAEIYLDDTVEGVILSVPAYFNDVQRKATSTAAQLAGLKVERLINEPTAAALAYGIDSKTVNQTYIVIDLGGGTFDVSIMEKFENILEVHASAGDSFLGGQDFTDRLVQGFCQENELDFITLPAVEKAKLLEHFNRRKHQLENSKNVNGALEVNGRSYAYELDREKFSGLVKPLLERLLAPIERSMRDKNIRITDLRNIFLVGGATRMPIIRQFIARLFGRFPSCHLNPEQVVVMGAAIQGALKQRNQDIGDLVLTDVCPFSMGIETSVSREDGRAGNGLYTVILERNLTIPVSREERFYTVNDNQKEIDVKIYQGEHRLVKNNVQLGSFIVAIPRARSGEESIDVRFTYDTNGLLEVIATVTSTGVSSQFVIHNSDASMSAKEIKKALEKLDKLKIHPREKSANQALLSKAERVYQQSLGLQRQDLGLLILGFESVLDSQDERSINIAAADLSCLLEAIDGSLWK